MTLKEAIAMLVYKDPSRTYCIRKEVWSHPPLRADGERSEDNSCYQVAMLPALNGKPCDNTEDATIEGALEKALALFPSGQPDTNDE